MLHVQDERFDRFDKDYKHAHALRLSCIFFLLDICIINVSFNTLGVPESVWIAIPYLPCFHPMQQRSSNYSFFQRRQKPNDDPASQGLRASYLSLRVSWLIVAYECPTDLVVEVIYIMYMLYMHMHMYADPNNWRGCLKCYIIWFVYSTESDFSENERHSASHQLRKFRESHFR